MDLVYGGLAASIAVLIVSALWWSRRRRRRLERRLREQEELAEVGRKVSGVLHDLSHLVGLIQINATMAPKVDDDEREAVLDDLRSSAALARDLFGELRRSLDEGPARDTSSEHVVRTLAGLIERTGVRVLVEVTGPFDPSPGGALAFLRLTENLMMNAAGEATLSGDPTIRVRVSPSRLTVRNRLRDPEAVDEGIYESGVSRVGSTGRGLAIARASAEALGCELGHRVEDGYVSFTVERAAAVAPAPARRVGT